MGISDRDAVRRRGRRNRLALRVLVLATIGGAIAIAAGRGGAAPSAPLLAATRSYGGSTAPAFGNAGRGAAR